MLKGGPAEVAVAAAANQAARSGTSFPAPLPGRVSEDATVFEQRYEVQREEGEEESSSEEVDVSSTDGSGSQSSRCGSEKEFDGIIYSSSHLRKVAAYYNQGKKQRHLLLLEELEELKNKEAARKLAGANGGMSAGDRWYHVLDREQAGRSCLSSIPGWSCHRPGSMPGGSSLTSCDPIPHLHRCLPIRCAEEELASLC